MGGATGWCIDSYLGNRHLEILLGYVDSSLSEGIHTSLCTHTLVGGAGGGA